MKQTITITEVVDQIDFDPNKLETGTVFVFQYIRKPTVYLMKTKCGATVLGRKPEKDCNCSDEPGCHWEIDPIKKPELGIYKPFLGEITIKQQTQ